eukprot:gene33828-40929_t
MSGIEEILWNVFTYYSLNGNPRDPSRLHSSHLNKFCKDVMAMDATMTEHPITSPELYLIYTAALTNPSRNSYLAHEKSDKIDFEAFLTCLIRIAQKCYPSCHTKEEAMQQFLMDNVLPLAPRRKPIAIQSTLKQPVIETLQKYYEDALMELYKFYTTSSDKNRKGKHMLKTTSTLGSTFDDQIDAIQEAKKKLNQESSSSNKMSYDDFIRFATDFGLVTTLGVTTLDLGDIFLSVISFTNFSTNVRKMSFGEFWEGLVRCALVAFQDKTELTTEIKIKGLFLSIWRHVQSSVQELMSGYGQLHGGGFNTYKGALLRGTQLLNDKFVAAWTKDEYRDYLAPLIQPGAGGKVTSAASHVPPPTPAAKKGSKEKAPPPPSHTSTPTPPPAPVSLLSKILKGGTGAQSDGNAVNATDNRAEDNEDNAIDADNNASNSVTTKAIAEHRRKNINHDSVAQSSDFVVKVPSSGASSKDVHVRVMIGEYEEFDDPRITVAGLRQVLHHNPSLALMLYDTLVEEGLMEEGEGEDDDVVGVEGEYVEEEGASDEEDAEGGNMMRIKSQKPFQGFSDDADGVDDKQVGEERDEGDEEKVETYDEDMEGEEEEE